MSSNLQVRRICQHCGKEFLARTTKTRYCSHSCNSRAYKARVKDLKVERSNTETTNIIIRPIELAKSKEFLTVKDVATLLDCSLRTVYRLINNDKLKAANIAERLTRVKRTELNKLLD